MLAETNPRRTSDPPAAAGVTFALSGGILVVTAFQAALTLGAPLGAAAQGGAHPGQLPDDLRLATGVATVLWLVAALLVLARGGHAVVALPQAVLRVGAWVLVGLLTVGAVLNFASSSSWERFGWGPFTLVLLTLSVVLSRSGLPPSRPAPRDT